MRGQTLGVLLSELRAECRYSQNQAHGINNRDSLVQVLKRTQRRLWMDWDWTHLRVSRDTRLLAGERYYNVPSDLTFERVEKNKAEVKFGGQWKPLAYGIDEKQYSIFDPRENQRSWPIERWDIAEDPQDTAGLVDPYGMFEVWPLPSDSGVVGGNLEGNLRLTGIRSLNPLSADADRCDLDSDLIVLYAAAEVLSGDRKDDAQAKLQMAQNLYFKLKGSGDKIRTFKLGGDEDKAQQQPEVFAHPVPFSISGS